MQTPPGSAMPSSRAAMLTPSPKMSLSSMMMSPTWMPIRKLDPDILWHVSVLSGHAALDLDRAACRVHRTREFYQYAVASRLDYAAPVGANGRIDKNLSY